MNISPPLLESAIDLVMKSPNPAVERFETYLPEFESILQLVFSDDHDPLLDNEKGMLLFFTDVMLTVFQQWEPSPELPSPEEVLDLFEDTVSRWDTLDGSYEEKIELFYASCKEQEAVAFLEDLLSDEELSPEGREILYITGYTVIRSLTLYAEA